MTVLSFLMSANACCVILFHCYTYPYIQEQTKTNQDQLKTNNQYVIGTKDTADKVGAAFTSIEVNTNDVLHEILQITTLILNLQEGFGIMEQNVENLSAASEENESIIREANTAIQGIDGSIRDISNSFKKLEMMLQSR